MNTIRVGRFNLTPAQANAARALVLMMTNLVRFTLPIFAK